MSSTLSAHNPRFNSKLVDVATVAALPEPMALGPHHKPVSHISLINALAKQAEISGYGVNRSQIALAGKGAQVMFGVMDLEPMNPADITIGGNPGERGMSIGFRNGTNESMAVKIVAGTRVFVCDNLSISGDLIALQKKNTTGLDLQSAVATGFAKFLQHVTTMDRYIDMLKAAELSDTAASALICDTFAKQIIPLRLFNQVYQDYFSPKQSMVDCHPRSKWGVLNAFTRSLQNMAPVSSLVANEELSKFIGLRSVN